MGHVHCRLFQLKEAEACFTSLGRLLATVKDARSLLDEDFENFLLCALFQSNELLLAPAA
jgi:hypothetical protein